MIVFLALVQSAFGQGTVRGTMTDPILGETVAFATIYVVEAETGTDSDLDGAYSIDLPAGIYTFQFSYVGYSTLNVTEVEVIDGEVTVLDVEMKEESELLDEVVVTAKQIRNTETALLAMQKLSNNTIDGVSSQAIRKFGDSNAAGAIKRVTGVSVQGGKYVFVRGLGDRYTKSVLNGMDIPGLDPDRNTLQMDIFPTNLVDNIVVTKSFSPDLPGDFTGGVVNIVTKDFPEEKTINVSGGLGYNPAMHLNGDYLSYEGSKSQFLGLDDNARTLPISTDFDIPTIGQRSGYLTSATQAFSNIWAAQKQKNFLDFNFGLSAGNQINKEKVTFGYNAALSYKKTTQYFDEVEYSYLQKDELSDVFELETDRTSTGSLANENVLLTGLLGGHMKIANHKIGLSVMHIQNGESRAGIFDQSSFINNNNRIIKDNLEYSERSISNALLSGKHLFDSGNFEVEWKYSPTISRVDDKDVRVAALRFEGGQSTIEPSEGAVPRRIWRYLDEVSHTGKLDLTRKFTLGGQPAKIKAGANYTQKMRDYSIFNFEFSTQGNVGSFDSPDEILAPENIWRPETRTGVFVTGNSEPANMYEAEQKVMASYIMGEIPLGEKLRAVVGVRGEQFTHNYTGQNNFGNIVFNDEKLLDQLDILPAANFIYSVNDNMNIRASFSQTLARPSFKELSIAQIYDAISDRTFIGNLDLEVTNITNYDVRWEHFGQRGQMFAVSGFYKDFTNPIELVAFNEQSPDNITPRNVNDATVLGVEVEFRKNLSFMSDALKNFSLGANLTFVDSKVTLDKSAGGEYESRQRLLKDGETLADTRTMQGQSPYIVNGYLNYSAVESGWEASLNYNVQGKRLTIVGISVNPDVFEKPFNALNFKVSKAMGVDRKFRMSLAAQNLLNAKRQKVYQSFGTADSIYEQFIPRQSFSLGASYRIQ